MLKMKAFSKSLNTSIEKLEDISLESVAGGGKETTSTVQDDVAEMLKQVPVPDASAVAALGEQANEFKKCSNSGPSAAPGFVALTAVGIVGAVGCSVASAVCKACSVRAARQGKSATSTTLQRAAVVTGICVAPFAGMGVVGGIGMARS